MYVHGDIQLTFESIPKMELRNTTGGNTTWGVLKAYVVFFVTDMRPDLMIVLEMLPLRVPGGVNHVYRR